MRTKRNLQVKAKYTKGWRDWLAPQEWSWLLLGILFIYMYAINHFMPLHRDDYEYALIWNTQIKLTSMQDVFYSLWLHYFEHGGRMVAFFMLDSFLLAGKEWFDPVNAFLYVALVILIYWHSIRRITWQFEPPLLLLIMAFTWLALPHFGEVAVWMTGAAVYLFTTVLILLFLLPYHMQLTERPLLASRILTTVGMFLAGILAGWTLENSAVTTVCLVTFLNYRQHLQKNRPAWMVSGLAGLILGTALLLAAPGSYVRAASIRHNPLLNVTNLLAAGGELLLYLLPVVLFLVLAKRILRRQLLAAGGVAGFHETKGIPWGSVMRLAAAAAVLYSAAQQSPLANGLGTLLFQYVAMPLHIATPKLHHQLFNVMAGVEEMLLYLLLIAEGYAYSARRLGVSAGLMKHLPPISYREIVKKMPTQRYTAFLLGLAVFNHLVMLASPSYPARAGFGLVVIVIIAAAHVYHTVQVKNSVYGKYWRVGLPALLTAFMVCMGAALLQAEYTLHRENEVRMEWIARQSAAGVKVLELEPLSTNQRILRHLFFVELNNGVSKGGLCRYYHLQDIHVKK